MLSLRQNIKKKKKTEYCVFIPDNSVGVSQLLSHMHKQIEALNDPLLRLESILGKWFGSKTMAEILDRLLCLYVCSCVSISVIDDGITKNYFIKEPYLIDLKEIKHLHNTQKHKIIWPE